MATDPYRRGDRKDCPSRSTKDGTPPGFWRIGNRSSRIGGSADYAPFRQRPSHACEETLVQLLISNNFGHRRKGRDGKAPPDHGLSSESAKSKHSFLALLPHFERMRSGTLTSPGTVRAVILPFTCERGIEPYLHAR